MKISIIAAGSRGDVQPYIALAVALQQVGHDVTLIVPANFARLVSQYQIKFVPIPINIQRLYQSYLGKQLISSGTNPLQIFDSVRSMISKVSHVTWPVLYHATKSSDAIVSHTVLAVFAQALAEKFQVPLFSAANMPLMRTRTHPASVTGLFTQNTIASEVSYDVIYRLFWAILAATANDLRQFLGLASGGFELMRHVVQEIPMLGGFSPTIYPRPYDWPAHHHVTGFWFLDEPEWKPPQSLVAFISEGSKPFYVGFGSMTAPNVTPILQRILDALHMLGYRAVLSAGWNTAQQLIIPPDVYLLKSAPHSWIFPRMRAVIHHGGAGTTAAGLRAAVPAMIVPFFADQPFWGHQVAQMRVGVTLTQQQISKADLLHAALKNLYHSTVLRQRASQMGAAIRAEDGGLTAARIIARY